MYPILFPDFNLFFLPFQQAFLKMLSMPNFVEIPPVGTALIHAEAQTGRHEEADTFPAYVKGFKNQTLSLS